MTARADHAKPMPRSDEWLTPPDLLARLGVFDTDPACPIPGTAPNMTWRTAKVCYSRIENGLLQAWHGDVFLNPPYRAGLVDRFMQRMAEHDRGIALVNSRTDTKWFARHVWGAAAAILFLFQRVHFIPAAYSDNRRQEDRNHNGHASALVAYGSRLVDRLADCGLDGALIPLPGSAQVIAVYRGDGISWSALIARVVERQGGEAGLTLVYAMVRRHPKAAVNQNWKAKVRQIMQGPAFERVAPATYRLKGVA